MGDAVELRVFQLLEIVVQFIARHLNTHTDALLPLLTDIFMERKHSFYSHATSPNTSGDLHDADDMSEEAFEIEALCPSAIFAESNQVTHHIRISHISP
jgi:hypothetical protein